MVNSKTALRKQILKMADVYYKTAFPKKRFIPWKTPIHVSGRVFDAKEIRYLIDASLDCWLTSGRFAMEFEKRFAAWVGVKYCSLVNSGSSASLLALTALTSPKLGNERLKPGDEVITLACGFPTTVNPIIQNRLVPVFVDVKIPSYNIDTDELKNALSAKTRAIMIAHTLGNPFNADKVLAFAKKHDLWVIEDCCDALGSLYNGKKAGTFGDIATFSFYPAHHLTMGEGGAVLTDDTKLRILIESFRDWGRDCWCSTGHDNTCKRRFKWKLGDLPEGYDHKYIYSHIGYNLKLTDMQAAAGCAQLDKLPGFIKKRKENFDYLYRGLKSLKKFIILPKATPGSKPSWFGFPITVRESSPVNRNELIKFLEKRKIGTRLLFGGNLIRQPAYKGVKYRKIGNLKESDKVMNQTFWIGVYPGLTRGMLDYVVSTIKKVYLY
jgi:CDP-4-dehydro-6-deoxyglucose reductase, E1